MNEQLNENNEDEVAAQWFENSYECSGCKTEWTDSWSCTCNDRCPECDTETEPTSSIDLSRPLMEEDYIGAARLISGLRNATPANISDEVAKAYAEAMLEGGEHRFTPPSYRLEKKHNSATSSESSTAGVPRSVSTSLSENPLNQFCRPKPPAQASTPHPHAAATPASNSSPSKTSSKANKHVQRPLHVRDITFKKPPLSPLLARTSPST